MLLVIKGDASVARDALARRQLEDVADFIEERSSAFGAPTTFTKVRVPEQVWQNVSAWYGESTQADLKPGVGFPDGTLLWFKYEGAL